MTPGWKEPLISSQVSGAAVTAAAATSLLPAQAKATLQPNFFSIGKQLVIEATGIISSVITTPGTAQFTVKFGGTTVFDGLAILLDSVAAHTNVGWWLRILLTCRAVGSAANLMGQGMWTCEDILGVPATAPKGVLTAILPWNSAPAVGNNFDSTTTQQVDLLFTQTVATGSCTCHQFSLAAYNQPS